jgi:GH25 family lysozyme M1 (1,4-beta-N-acetylmuramidase)
MTYAKEKTMSTERSGIDPYKGDIKKDWSL